MNLSAETEFSRLRRELKRGAKIISLNGLTSVSAKSCVLNELQKTSAETFVIVTDSNKELEMWENDLEFFGSTTEIEKSPRILSLPSFETNVYAGISPHAETQEERALTLWRLAFSQPDFLIVSAKTLITKTPAPKEISNLGARLKRDEDFSPDELIEKLVSVGYVREEPIKNVGEFSVRGGILDVWSPTAANPVRIEFFGDTVDSIREFDAETQLSVGQLKEISVAPMREFAATEKDFKDWSFFARERFSDEKFARNLKDRTQFAEEGESFNGWEFLISLVSPKNSSVFDFLKTAVIVIDEPSIIEQSLENFYEILEENYAQKTEADDIALAPDELFLTGDILREKLEKFQRIELRALGKTAAITDQEFQMS